MSRSNIFWKTVLHAFSLYVSGEGNSDVLCALGLTSAQWEKHETSIKFCVLVFIYIEL